MKDSRVSDQAVKGCAGNASKARLPAYVRSTVPDDTPKDGSPEAQTRFPQRCILCVQPNPRVRANLVQALGDCRCVIALSGFEAICCLNAHVFDGYVLDYWLPDWSGLSLCREIRKADPHGPIVFYSSTSGRDQCKRIARAGANASLSPPEPNAVRDQLYTLLDHARLDSLKAITAAQHALQQEFERRTAAMTDRPDRAQHMTAQAVERTAKIRTYTAFVESGGTRADFERWWPQAFRCAMAGAIPAIRGEVIFGMPKHRSPVMRSRSCEPQPPIRMHRPRQ